MTEIGRGLVKTRYGYIHYRSAGEGPPILLFSINQQSSDLYRELMVALAPRFRTVAMDYPSHGGSDHVSAQPSIADYAACAVELADALGLDRFAVLGEATGTAVALELSGAYPRRVSRTVLVNCPELEPDRAAAMAEFQTELRPADETGFPRLRTIDWLLAHDPVHAPLHPTQDWMDRLNRAQVECGRDRWQALTALFAYDLPAAQARVTQPVLLLVGEHFYCREQAPLIAGRMADCRWFELPGGRFCAGWEKADEIAARVIDFATSRRPHGDGGATT